MESPIKRVVNDNDNDNDDVDMNPKRTESDAVFENRPLTMDQVNLISDMIMDQPDSFEGRLRKGHEPAWLTGVFMDNKLPVKRIYCAWVDSATKKLIVPFKAKQSMAPPFICISPAGPLGRVFITPEACLNVKNPTPTSITQRVYFKPSDYDEVIFGRWKKCLEYMHDFLNDKRARAMADSLSDHDMLSYEDREIGMNDPEALYQKITGALANESDTSHRICATHGPKHKMFKEIKLKPNQSVPHDVKAVDKLILAELKDDSNQFDTWVKEKNGLRTFTLLPITLPDATALEPSELGYIHGEGGIASMSWLCYGVHCRRDGPLQHTVMLQNAGIQIFSNGKKQGSTQSSFNIMDMLIGKDKDKDKNQNLCSLKQNEDEDEDEDKVILPVASTSQDITPTRTLSTAAATMVATPMELLSTPSKNETNVNDVRMFMKDKGKRSTKKQLGTSSKRNKSEKLIFPDDD